MEIQKYTFTLNCVQRGAVKGLGGSEIHGSFFAALKEMDDGYSGEVHDRVDKPFALSPLYGRGQREPGFFQCAEGERYSFSIAALDSEMAARLEELAGNWSGRRVCLGSSVFIGVEVKERFFNGISYQDILLKDKLPLEFTLAFRTPTSFRQSGRQYLFPTPELVFGSLFRRWNCHSPIQLQDGIDFSDIIVSRFDLHTEMVQFEDYKILGFTGRCHYRLPAKCPDFLAFQLHALARYAEIAGVGYKVTMGLGDTALVMKQKK